MDLNQSLSIAKALADRSRLLIVNALAKGSLCTEEMATMLDLAPSTVSFHAQKLVQAGLVSARREQYYSFYALTARATQLTLADMIHFDSPVSDLGAERLAKEEARVVKSFFSGGRLTRMPVQQRKRRIVLGRFAAMFELSRTYQEREVDGVIEPVFADYCLVRRLLIEEGYMERDHGVYRRTDRPAADQAPVADTEGKDDMGQSSEDKKRLKEEYKNRKRIGGVFAITNTTNGKVFLGSCPDADRPLRRIQFELELGSFKNRELQRDFAQLGVGAFRFEVVETVAASAENPDQELEALEEKHVARLDRSNTYNRGDRIRFR